MNWSIYSYQKQKLLTFYLIVNIILDYFKKTVYNLFAANIQEAFSKTSPQKLLVKILEKYLRAIFFSKVNHFKSFLVKLQWCLNYSTCWFLPAARRLWHTWEVRINHLLLWVLAECFLPSPFISISESIIFHLQRRNPSLLRNRRENERYNAELSKRLYIWIYGYRI